MIDAVGSNARCGSAVLIVNELSTTSVGFADECVVAPYAASAQTSAIVAVSGSSQTARRTGDRLTRGLLFSGGELCLDPIARRSRRCAFRLQPARSGAAGLQRHELRVVGAAAVEDVRAAWVEAAAPRRI